ncbi:ROK family transcriptional regulator [Curtobacterium flaccumfaciens]|uniref:ROK family transcriptional regulator n=1 Tax=Curtobacterium flaccumfaciens TaxID=2035 RepID=UPI001BDE02FE|nr:ROK family transcriptional regulator [Curtobacterium flaccumfaciens]MBT1608355.1 ROK family transcriptional regulator [Curtobacterium flaccumfaciens pv. betae]MBT1656644.1 ROK family transcriptional regulator [Curtobacterium flaccumfaciens pv. betae]MCS0470819.1 ROK family transcriptional regulator [Curtobacterium flaccumfaciens pv. betae]MCS0475689.1 ROK family transcriptional regulator [Curtobacterium flaccumfaciens pv. betae]MCS0477231.1 ROK family transcriptional regulator [Curtobacteri
MAEHRRGANLPSIGGFNRTVVLDAVRRSPDGLSRVELAARTGLSAQTVSNVTRFLIEAGMIVESGTVVSGRGKPRTILRLEPGSRYAVGVHVDPAVVTYVLLDLAGTVVAASTTSTPTADDPSEVVRTIASAVDGLVADAGVAVDSVLGVGIASPGPIDVEAGIVVDPPFLPRWRDVPLRDALAEATGYPVLLEKDVTAAAVGEMFLAGESSARNFAFVYFGTGFGVGLVVDHEPVRGVGSNAGDAGHIMVDQGSLAGTPDGSGTRGEVGAAVAPDRLVRIARSRGLALSGGGAVTEAGAGAAADAANADSVDAVNAAWDELAVAIADGDDTAVTLAAEAGTVMGNAAVLIVNLLDIDRVVFGGPFWSRIASAALPAARTAIVGSPLLVPKHAVQVVESDRGADVAAVGAACLVLDAALSPRASTLLIRR